MSQGIKIVKPGYSVKTAFPSNIAVDSRQPGAMKVAKRLVVRRDAKNMINVGYNQGGILSGTFEYKHGLGYAPPFLAYFANVNGKTGLVEVTMLPGDGPLFGPDTTVTSDSEYIRVLYLDAEPQYPGFEHLYTNVIIYLFAEDLNADV